MSNRMTFQLMSTLIVLGTASDAVLYVVKFF